MSEHTLSIFLISTILSFKNIENKHYVCRAKDCMKKFCQSLKENVIKTTNIKKTKNKVIKKKTKKKNPVKFVKKNSKIDIWKIKNIIKLEINVIIQENIDALCIAYVTYSVFQKVPIVFHNRYSCDYHFIIKELA